MKNLFISGCVITRVALAQFSVVYADPVKSAGQKSGMTQKKDKITGQMKLNQKAIQ